MRASRSAPESAAPPPAAVAARVAALRDALRAGDGRWSPGVAEHADADLAHVEARLALGIDRTVVALVGGTGSGKSHLANAVAGLAFADVGLRRPTTAEPVACTWGDGAAALLDYLGVPRERRIRRESALDAGRQDALNGLVLLDMPDHDSVEPEHALLVDRLLPLVDLLVWVVDPQKYADAVLHERYLQALADRADAMVVVVNQVDTVPAAAVGRIATDLGRLLESDGLRGVPVLAASAETGEGIGEVRALLARVVAGGSFAAWLAGVETDAVARHLREDLGGPRAAASGSDTALRAAADDGAAELVRAVGLDAVVTVLRDPTVSSTDAPRPGGVAASAAAAIRSRVVDVACRELPERWADAVGRAVGEPDTLTAAVSDGVQGVPLPAATAGRAWSWAAVGLVLVALAAGVCAVAGVLGGPPAAMVGALAVGLAALSLATGRRARQRAAGLRAEAYDAAVRAAVREAVDRVLVRPAAAVRAEHATIWAVVGTDG